MRIKAAWSASCALALTAVVATSSPAAATVTKSVSFDESSAPTLFTNAVPLRERYAGKGIHFKGPTAQDGGAILDEDGSWAADPRSGVQFLAFNADPISTMDNGGMPVGPETITFDRLQNVVKIYVSQSGSGESATFRMVAKRAGSTVDTAQVTTTTNDWSLLRVSVSGGIRKVVLNADHDPDGAWVADDLTIKRN